MFDNKLIAKVGWACFLFTVHVHADNFPFLVNNVLHVIAQLLRSVIEMIIIIVMGWTICIINHWGLSSLLHHNICVYIALPTCYY